MIVKYGQTLLACVAAAALCILGVGGSLAQDEELGAGIYEGTCELAGASVVEDIGDLEVDDDAARSTPMIAGTPVAGPVYEEDEGLTVSLADLTGAPHVILIRASDNPDAPLVACGAIAGEATTGVLQVPLLEVSGSGITGVATFGPPHPSDDDGDQAEVIVQVQRGGGMASTPAA